MSVIVQCPNCHDTVQFYRLPVERCARCQAEYPEAVRHPAESALGRDLSPKPSLLVLGQFVTSFMAGIVLLLLVLAPFNLASYSIDGQVVTGLEFLRDGGLSFALIGGWFAAIAIGLWRERAWARPVMLAYWPISAALVVALSWHDAHLLSTVVSTGLFTLIAFPTAAWYLYDKENVVAYFKSRAREVSRDA